MHKNFNLNRTFLDTLAKNSRTCPPLQHFPSGFHVRWQRRKIFCRFCLASEYRIEYALCSWIITGQIVDRCAITFDCDSFGDLVFRDHLIK
jgi:hypothetical protein